MNFYRINQEIIVCYSKKELVDIFKNYGKKDLKGKVSIDVERLKKTLENFSKVLRSRDNHEIFIATFSFLDFFESKSEVCFKLENFNTNKDRANTLEELNRFRAKTPDFIIKSGDKLLRHFELKRYRNKIDTEELFNYIKKTIREYGDNIGNTNIIFLIQPEKPFMRVEINFQNLYQNIKSLNYKFNGQILLNWNENCDQNILVQLYPKLTKQKIDFKLPTQQLN